MDKKQGIAYFILLILISASISFGIERTHAAFSFSVSPSSIDFGKQEVCFYSLTSPILGAFRVDISGDEAVTVSAEISSGASEGFFCIRGCSPSVVKPTEYKIVQLGLRSYDDRPRTATGQATVTFRDSRNRITPKTVDLKAEVTCTLKASLVPSDVERVPCDGIRLKIKECYITATLEDRSCSPEYYACKDVVIDYSEIDERWAKYEVVCFLPEGEESGIDVGWRLKVGDRVCSIGDKTYNFSGEPANPLMKAGKCDCSVGGVYKICCKNNGDGTYTAVDAVKIKADDTNPPYEAVCPASVDRPVVPYVTECPGPINYTLSVSAKCELADGTITDLIGEKITTCLGEITTPGSKTTQTEYNGNCTLTAPDPSATNPSCKFDQWKIDQYAGKPNGTKISIGKNNPTRNAIAYYKQETPEETCSTNCGRCSDTFPGTYVKWYDDNGGCNSGFYTCRTETPNDSRCLQYYCSNNQCVSATTCPGGTCYLGDSTCANKCGGIQPPQDKGADVTIPTFSINNVNKGTACIPQQLGERRDVTISWGATVKNQCVLPASASASPPQGEWKGGWTLVTPNDGDCAAYAGSAGWSGSLGLSGSRSLITSPSATTTYTISCSRPAYDCEWYRNYTYTYDCSYYHVCVTDPLVPEKPKSCGTAATCEQNENTTCEYIQKTCTATDSVEVAGGHFDGSIKSASSTLAVIQPLSSVTITPRLQKENNFFKVIKNISFIIEWFSGAPSSVVRTTISCAPSITYSTSGEYKGWASRGTLAASGNTPKEVSNENDAIYRLTCYNRYNGDPNCYTSKSASAEVKAFGTELEPKAGWLERIRDIFLTTRVNTGLAGGE
jgi:hypothetical protein